MRQSGRIRKQSDEPTWAEVRAASRWTKQQGRWVASQCRRSGLNVCRFAALHDIGPQRIYFWLKQCGKDDTRPVVTAPKPIEMLEVAVPAALRAQPGRAERVEIELCAGRRLSVAATIDVSLLQRLVEALEQGC